MAASHLCDFVRFYIARWRWAWWGVLLELAETKNNLSAFNAKSKGGRAKNST